MVLRRMFWTIVFLILASMYQPLAAQNATLSPDSIQKLAADPNFIRTSLLYITPGTAVYSTAGHCAMRLECPTHQMDYCFTFEGKPDANIMAGFLTGHLDAHYTYLKTADFVEHFRQRGRGIQSIQLNLSPQEKQELWRFLDAEAGKRYGWNYDYLHYNCSSMMLYAMEACLQNDRLDFHDLTPWLQGSNRYILQEVFRDSPWSELFWNMALGTDGEQTGNTAGCMAPTFLFSEIQKATLTDSTGTVRQAVAGKPACLLEAEREDRPVPATPAVVFIGLLILSVATTTYDLCVKRGYSRSSRLVDVAFTAIVTAIGLVYTYLILFSDQVGTSWNWLALAFNPLFFMAWCCLRKKKKAMQTVYATATTVLVLTVVATPWLPQLQTSPLAWLLLAFAVRTLAQLLQPRIHRREHSD